MKKIVTTAIAVYAAFAIPFRHGWRCYQSLAGVFAKQKLLCILTAWTLLVCACASGGTSTDKTVSLDQAIQTAVENIERNLPAVGLDAAAAAADSAEQAMQSGDTGFDSARRRAQSFSPKPRIAVLNFNSPSGQLSEYILEKLSSGLVNGKKLVVVERSELDVIQKEMTFQMSGEVSDSTQQAIGQKLGAQFVVSGSVRQIGGIYDLTIKTLNVESAAVIALSSANISVRESKVKHLLADVPPVPEDPVVLASASGNKAAEYRVSNTRELLDAVDTINRQGAGDYVIILTGNISLAQNDREIRFTSNAQKTVTLRGDGSVRSLSSVQNAYLLEVPSAVTLMLGGNLRLSSTSGRGIISVNDRGTLRMETGVTITGYDGVLIDEGGAFIMNGGAISGMGGDGESICVGVAGTFTINGGTISDCGDYVLGGVQIYDNDTFTMNGGAISTNRTVGVLVGDTGTFIMNNGTISNNTGNINGYGYGGGGVLLSSSDSTFTMTGGTISGNTIDGNGGGVYVGDGAIFIKTGGTITANNRATLRGNVVGGSRIRNSAAGPSVRLDSRIAGSAGGWE